MTDPTTSGALPADATPTTPNPAFQPVPPEGGYEVPMSSPTPAAAARPKAVATGGGGPGGISWVNVALGVALAIAIGGAAFAAGRMTAPASAAANGGTGGRGNGNFPAFGGDFPGGGFGRGGGGYFGGGFGRGGGAAGASIQGTVTAVSPTSITIQTAGGQTVTLNLSSGTTYHVENSASSSDVQTGGTVIVRLGIGGGGSTSGGPTVSDITVVPNP
jgi:hypothetical protein